MGKFNKGFLLGGILGAVLMWMSTTKKGRATRDEIIDHAEKVYEEVKKKILASQTWKDLKKNDYAKRVKEVVDEYAVKYHLSENIKNLVTKVLGSQWERLRKELGKK